MAAAAILLLGFALRLAPWGDNRFLEDEALYSFWGLQIATGTDLMLREEPVDKPPLQPYTLALSLRLFGGARSGAAEGQSTPEAIRLLESAARVPSLLASMTSIALVIALGREMFGDACIGLVGALLLAVSPFDILFASTAFTDPLMTALVLGAVWAAARRQMGAAGLLAGLALATKQQAALFLPLVVAAGVSGEGARLRGSKWLPFALGLAIPVAGMVTWDLARARRPGFFEQGVLSYGALRMARLSELGERGAAWLQTLAYFWASRWFEALLLAAWATGAILAVRKRTRSRVGVQPDPRIATPRGSVSSAARRGRSVRLLAGFVLAFLAFHWVMRVQVWDRYLLGMVPLVSFLAAAVLIRVGGLIDSGRGRRLYGGGLALILLVALAAPAVHAAKSGYPVGGDHGAYDGMDELAAYLRSHAPPNAVLYDHWLGYHYRFYLYGARLRIHWYPDLTDLSHDAFVYRREPRYIAFPSWRDGGPAERELASAGIRLEPVFETTRRDDSISFRLFRLAGP